MRKEGQTKKYQGEKKEKRKGGKKKGAYVAVLTRNTDEVPQWFRDASQVVSLWMSNYLDTTTGNMRQSARGKGQDYKFSSFRTPKRTEVENNPQPYPVRENSLSHWWQIGCHFQKRLKTKACAQLERSPASTLRCIEPVRMYNYGTLRPIAAKAATTRPKIKKRGFALKRAESNNRYMMDTVSSDFFDEWVKFTVQARLCNTTAVGGRCGSVLPCSCSIRVIAILEPWASNTTWPWDTDERKCFVLFFWLQMINSFLRGIAWRFDTYTYLFFLAKG